MWPRLAWVFASRSTSEGLFVGGLKGTDGEIVEDCESSTKSLDRLSVPRIEVFPTNGFVIYEAYWLAHTVKKRSGVGHRFGCLPSFWDRPLGN